MARVFYCAEDSLSRSILQRLFKEYCGKDLTLTEMVKGSYGLGKMKVERNFKKFFAAAAIDPVIALIDLDKSECPPSLRRQWIRDIWKKDDLPQNMFFCIAEVEAESWLFADSANLSNFIGISEKKISHTLKIMRRRIF